MLFSRRKIRKPDKHGAASAKEANETNESPINDERSIYLYEDMLKVAYWLNVQDPEKLKANYDQSKKTMRIYVILSIVMQIT